MVLIQFLTAIAVLNQVFLSKKMALLMRISAQILQGVRS